MRASTEGGIGEKLTEGIEIVFKEVLPQNNHMLQRRGLRGSFHLNDCLAVISEDHGVFKGNEEKGDLRETS